MLVTNETVATRRKREDESEGKRTRANVGIKIGAIANLVPLMANLVPLLTRCQTRTRKFTSLVKSSVFNRELVNATVRKTDIPSNPQASVLALWQCYLSSVQSLRLLISFN